MIINFLKTASIAKPNLLKAWYNSSDGIERIVDIREAAEYNGAAAKIQQAKDRKKLNDSVINNYKLTK